MQGLWQLSERIYLYHCCNGMEGTSDLVPGVQELRLACARLEAAREKAETRAEELESELQSQRASTTALRQVALTQLCWLNTLNCYVVNRGNLLHLVSFH